MDIGIFAKIFNRPSLADTLDAIASHGIHFVQFNMACAGLPTLPDYIPANLCEQIVTELHAREMHAVALSGTFNMIHPDPMARADGMKRLRVLTQAAHRMGMPIITLCTGTRDTDNMWRRHPENDSRPAWDDLIDSMAQAIQIATDADVLLGVEPELSNVISSARAARRLLDVMQTSRLKIIMDGSNLIRPDEILKMRVVFDEAFDLLGDDIILVHAKDLIIGGEESHGAAGTGVLDYDDYLSHLQRIGYKGALILHTLREDQVDASVAFLESKLAAISSV